MRKLVLFISFFLACQVAMAQDVHFSQFTASPMNLNPAMTGVFNGDYRFAGIYRNQWASVTSPFISYGGSFDAALFRRKMRGNSLGLGAIFLSDKAGDANYGSNSFLFSISYRILLSKYSSLSMGIQTGMMQSGYDRNALQFGSQYQNGAFVATNPDGEVLGTESFTKLDLNAGLLFTANLDKTTNFYIGTSAKHLNRSTVAYIAQNWKTYPYFNFHSGIDFEMNDAWSMSPNVWLLNQGPSMELMLGSYFSYRMMHMQGDDKTMLSFGAWYRVGDAIVAAMRLNFMNVQFGFSYDINISGLSVASGAMGGPEVSVIIIGPNNYRPKGYNQPCPRF